MKEKRKVHQLNVFLIKPSFSSSNQVLKVEDCTREVKIPIAGYGDAQLFVKTTPPMPPKWSALFSEFVDPLDLATRGVAAALFIKIDDRAFVLAFGQGGRFLLRDDVHEERFGLLCALNSVDPKTFRCVDLQSLDAIQSHSRIQSGQETTPDQFGLDIEQDMLKAIVGSPLKKGIGSRMTGSDALSVSVKMNLSDLPFLLKEYRAAFEADLSEKEYQWVNNVSMTKSAEVRENLEAALDAKLRAGDFRGLWLSIPEIVDWTMVKGFMYTHGKNELHPDINWDGFRKSLKLGTPITLDLLKARKVSCADADHQKVFKQWAVFKCLYAEVNLGGSKYILNDGSWFNVAPGFVERTDMEFAAIPFSSLAFPEYCGGGEGAYNEALAATEPTRYALLDAKPIAHGGGRGQVEVCDLLSVDRELIHVKIYGKSSVFSHLFAQGFVSGQLMQIDSTFRDKVRSSLQAPFSELIKVDARPASDEFTVVYAVISDDDSDGLHLPFFSRVNLNNTRKMLRGYGYKVELLKIAVSDAYSKTTKIPANRRRKSA